MKLQNTFLSIKVDKRACLINNVRRKRLYVLRTDLGNKEREGVL